MKKQNKGFTLVELMTTIVLLAIVMSIAGYSIIAIVNNAKERDYQLLIENINNAVEVNYQECKYSSNDKIKCPEITDGYYNIKLGDLVKYGYLKGNSNDSNNKLTLVNPDNNVNISDCSISYKYIGGKIEIISAADSSASCPTTDDYSSN